MYLKIRAQIEEVRVDGVETCRDWLGVHCAMLFEGVWMD